MSNPSTEIDTKNDTDPFMNTFEGPTFNGGIRTEYFYYDEDHQPTTRSNAKFIDIHEIDDVGHIITGSWFIIRK